ncbi:MAG: putative nucleic-acid-binding protein containing a Zn-ribbon, partial [Actinomycetia bacterium]|nr:putative nucleic-acid-binding protein containing a Zn-ribbon [Actinomycetes bacterium]
MAEKTRVPAVEGWFVTDDEPALVGARGTRSGSYFFPTSLAVSGNPHTPGEERENVLLSRTGRVWSWTTNHYAPPEPYMSPDPFVPYTVVAVELQREQMVVLGLLADGADPADLEVGTEVHLDVGPLYEDADHEYTV